MEYNPELYASLEKAEMDQGENWMRVLRIAEKLAKDAGRNEPSEADHEEAGRLWRMGKYHLAE
jgi:hypothetical protein